MSPYVGPDHVLMPSVGGLVRQPSGALLFVQSTADGLWSIPGGTVEMDETPVGAVMRELREETGLIVRPTRIFAVYGGPEFVVRHPNGDEKQYINTIFECAIVGGALHPDGEETTSARFCTQEAAAALVLSPWLVRVLPRLFQPTTETWFESAVKDARPDPGAR